MNPVTVEFDAIRLCREIPSCLRELPQWVCWRYITRGGKQTKCPISSTKGGSASSTNPSTWGTFEQAVTACRRSKELAGVGFVFSSDDPFAGIDLDNCVDEATGQIKPWALSIIRQLDSYAEISPSGTGVKIFVRAVKPGPRCKSGYEDGAVEMYDCGRFFTVTGARLPDTPVDVEERQAQFGGLYDRVFSSSRSPKPAKGAANVVETPASLDDDTLIEKARAAKNGDRFSALFDHGDTSGYSGDDSAADQALCNLLAFWTRDVGQLDRLFRRSALIRGKWDEKHYGDGRTYGQGTITTALESVTETYRPSSRGKKALPGGVCYRATPGGLVWDKHTQNGPVPFPLANFSAKIVADVTRDDGVETTHVFTLEAELHGRRKQFDVPAGRFNGLLWVTEALGARAIVYAGYSAKDHTRAAIQMLSEEVECRTVFTHLGWRKIEGRWVYLHAGGAIAPEAPNAPEIQVDTGLELSRLALPVPPRGERATDAVKASLGMLLLARDDAIIPVWASIWRSVLGPSDFTIHLNGGSGVFKTELAALAQQHFGKELDARNLPGSWSSTGNSLEALAFAAKDALLVVDDFAPSGTSNDVAKLHREAARLIRAQGNRSGRGRLRSDATLRPAKCPRGLILSTGEDVPAGHSVRARLGVIEIESGTISQPELTRCQKDALRGLYAEAMAAFLKWMAPKYGKVRLPEEVGALREAAYQESGGHRRTPVMVANLFLGIRYFTDFAREIGVFDDAGASAFERRCWAALGTFAADQVIHLQACDPVDRFCELLASALASGRAHVADPNGEAPHWDSSDDDAAPIAWGWRRVTVGTGSHARDGWHPQGIRIGWYAVDGDNLYLDAESACRAAQDSVGPGADGISVTARTLVKRLKERGYLKSTDGARGKNTVQRVLQGQRRNVVHLHTSALITGVRAQRAHRARGADPKAENGDRAPETCARNNCGEESREHVGAHSRDREGGFAPHAPVAPVTDDNPPAQKESPEPEEPDAQLEEDVSAATNILIGQLPGIKPDNPGAFD